MQYRNLGRTGLKVSALCLGTMTFGWSTDPRNSFAIMSRAFEAGINFFDTADIYSRWYENNKGGESETLIGRWLKTQDRRQVIIATKARGIMWAGVNGQGLSRHHLIHACEDSLRRLQTDYIDLYQMHWYDDETPLEETLHALDTLVRAGKVRYVGVSNYPAWMLMKALWTSDRHGYIRFDSIQPHYSLVHRSEFERELEPACLDQGIGVIPYSPLAAGFLTGKYTRDNHTPDTTRADGGLIRRLLADDHAFTVVNALREIAAEHDNAPVAQIALAWMLARPSMTAPIIGARTLAQLEETIGATEITLTDVQIKRLTDLTTQY